MPPLRYLENLERTTYDNWPLSKNVPTQLVGVCNSWDFDDSSRFIPPHSEDRGPDSETYIGARAKKENIDVGTGLGDGRGQLTSTVVVPVRETQLREHLTYRFVSVQRECTSLNCCFLRYYLTYPHYFIPAFVI